MTKSSLCTVHKICVNLVPGQILAFTPSVLFLGKQPGYETSSVCILHLHVLNSRYMKVGIVNIFVT